MLVVLPGKGVQLVFRVRIGVSFRGRVNIGVSFRGRVRIRIRVGVIKRFYLADCSKQQLRHICQYLNILDSMVNICELQLMIYG